MVDDFGTLKGGGDCLLHYHKSDRFPTRDTLNWLQSLENVKTITTNYTVTLDDDIVIINGTGLVVTLPAAKNGRHIRFVIKTGSATLTPFGAETIGGATTHVINITNDVCYLKAIVGGWVNLVPDTAALDGKQPLDATLTALAGLATGADQLPYFTGTDVVGQTSITPAARSVIDDLTVAAMVDTLGGAASTGTGGIVRAISPTLTSAILTSPALGTPASVVLTNATGLPTAGLIDLAVTTAKIADLNVTTAKIADLNVTTGKLADLNVTTAKIADLNVTTGKIADLNVTSAKIQANPTFAGVNATGSKFFAQVAPTAINATATATVAQLLTLIITSTSAAITDITLPTGTLMDGGYSALVDMGFAWDIINTGPSAVNILAGVDHTIVGAAGTATLTSSSWRSRRTAANVWVTYRV